MPSSSMNSHSIHPTVLATFPSKSSPGKVYEVRLGKDGNLWCGCPSWRFQKNSPTNRSCKHIVEFKATAAGSHFSHGPEPVAIRATRRPRVIRAAALLAPLTTIPAPVQARAVVGCPEDDDYIPEDRRTSWERILDDEAL